MKKYFLTIFRLGGIFWLAGAPLDAAPKLDIGAEYRLRGIQLTNPTYASEEPLGSGKTFDQQYNSHRARVYLKGKLDPGIEIATVIQAISVTGSSAPLLNRYPKEDFSPFIENIYLQANEIHDWPINVTIGRQPYTWGSGLLLADDGLGFDGIRLDAGPFWGIRSHLFTAKVKENFVGDNDKDLFLGGLSYAWGIHNIKLGWIWERDRSGTLYSNLNSSVPVTAEQISRKFLNLQLDGKLERGAFYKAEYVLQKGSVKLPDQEISLSGSALTFEGGFDFVHPRYKRMILSFIFMQGSGDDAGTKDEDEKFNPSFGHKFDGLERAGAGEFFAATPYSFFNEAKVRVITFRDKDGKVLQSFPYQSLFSGVRTFGFKGSVNPWETFIAGLEFYIYNARSTPDIRDGAPTTVNDNELGRELVISASYLYAKRIQAIIRWGKFFPSANLNNVGSSRLILEISGRF